MKVSEAILKLTNIQKEEGDIDFCTLVEIDEFFGVGTAHIEVVEYPIDESEQTYKKVVTVSNSVDFNDENPGLRIIK